MRALLALIAVTLIAALAWACSLQDGLRLAVGAGLPAAGAGVFLAGIVWRVLAWAKAPVPFRIPVTSGQQASFAWLKPARLDNPSTTAGVLGRMALEVLLFRSLFRNVKAERRSDRFVFRDAGGLWLAALLFHYSLLVIALRHLRFVLQPVPGFVTALAALDSYFTVGVPALYVTDAFLIAALGYLLLRRLREPQLRMLSLFADYFFLFLLLGIAITGLLMRHVVRVDTVAMKELAMGLATLSRPVVSSSLHPLAFVHLALAAMLLASLPFTKLAHVAGVWLSPARNLANDNRARRHVNPWNYPVKVHSYEEWEDEFRDKMVAAGLPVEGRADHV